MIFTLEYLTYRHVGKNLEKVVMERMIIKYVTDIDVVTELVAMTMSLSANSKGYDVY